MISNEDYSDIRKGAENNLTILYRYYTANYGPKVSAGHFMIKFQEWCVTHLKTNINEAVNIVVDYLDIKHEYQGII